MFLGEWWSALGGDINLDLDIGQTKSVYFRDVCVSLGHQ